MAYQEATNPTLGFFDGIRGILSFLVLLTHALYMTNTALPVVMRTALPLLDVFMFMSGFFMAYHYRARQVSEPWGSHNTWISFYIRRFFRIAPLYYVLLTIAYFLYQPYLQWAYEIIATFHIPYNLKADPSVRTLTTLNVFSHYSFLFGFVPQFASNNPIPDWTIGLEMQFYFAFPFLMLIYVRLGYAWGTLLFVIIWLVALNVFGVGVPPPKPGLLADFPQPTLLFLKLDCFIIGILVAEAYYLKGASRNASVVCLVLAMLWSVLGHMNSFIVPFLISVLLLFYNRNSDAYKISRPLRVVDAFLSSRFCKYVGDSSYSVYLLHLMVLTPLVVWLNGHDTYLHLSPLARYLILIGLGAPVIYALSYLAFNFIEKPGVILGKKIVIKSSYYLNINKTQTAR